MLINLHGYLIHCDAPSHDLEAKLVRPFGLFRIEQGVADVTVKIIVAPFPYQQFPELEASFSTPRNVVYDTKKLKIVDYFGKGATVEDKCGHTFTIYGTDDNFLQEAFYLLVLSIFGQYCDRNGMLRIHAMAVSYGNRAILMPVPPGGGKSTMAVAILKEDGFKLISDDEPIISPSGSILPFALRIGMLDKEKIRNIPAEFVYSIDRMEFGLKYYIDAQYWGDQLEQRTLDEVIFLAAQRVLNGKPSIRQVSKFRILKSLVRDVIIGVGLYQGLEFMLGHSPWTTISQAGTVLKRSRVAWKMLRHTRTYQFILSRDIDENRRALSEFVRNLDE